MATVVAGRTPLRSNELKRFFYVLAALLVCAIVATGFGPRFYAVLVLGESRPWIIHVHGAVYVGWLVLLVAQGLLAARGKLALHRRIGNFGIAYGVLVILVGLTVTFVAPALHVRAGEWTMDRAAGFLTIPLGDMVLFGSAFGAAIVYRHRPEIHKRLMLLASVALMFAAVGRVWFVHNMVVELLLWYLPVAVAIGYDLYTRRRIHPVYLIGVIVMAAGLLRIPFGQSETWLPLGRALLEPLV
jgi:hypothetical protein